MAPRKHTLKQVQRTRLPDKFENFKSIRKSIPDEEPRRSSRLLNQREDKALNSTSAPEAQNKQSHKRAADNDNSPPAKRSKESISQPIKYSSKSESISHWCREKTWPEELFSMDYSNLRMAMLAKPALNRKRSLGSSSAASSDQQKREQKTTEYYDRNYAEKLALQYYYMDPSDSEEGASQEELKKISSLLSMPATPPEGSRFDSTCFGKTCQVIRYQNEATITRIIGELMFPHSHLLGADYDGMKNIINHCNELWCQAVPIFLARPQPDGCAGFRQSAFTQDQREKLMPFMGTKGTDASYFAANTALWFPFAGCEVKRSDGGLGIADNQAALSMFIAARSVVNLYRLAQRNLQDLHGRFLSFSLSHNDDEFRIYGYYVLHKEKDPAAGKRAKGEPEVTYHRHMIARSMLQANGGDDRWQPFTFFHNVYRFWAAPHLRLIQTAVDALPSPQSSPVNFRVAAQETGLTQYVAASSISETERATLDLDTIQPQFEETTPESSLSQSEIPATQITENAPNTSAKKSKVRGSKPSKV